jgi:hypothetical protein
MSEPTFEEDLAALRRLADRLDPDLPWPAAPAEGDADSAGLLRRVAGHLHRIGTGGDRAAPEGLTADPMPYQASPPPNIDVGIPADDES